VKLLATISLEMRNSERPFTPVSGNYLAHQSMMRETSGIREALNDRWELLVKL